jgi:FkbM family methyltransferase
MRVLKLIKEKAWFWIHLNRRSRIVSRFSRLCKNIHRASEHPTYDVSINGEKDILGLIASVDEPTLFDVGSNVGDWALMAHFVRPNARIHSFEMNPSTAERLKVNTASVPQIDVHAFGLSNKNEEATFYSYEGEQSVLSSLRANLYSSFKPVEKTATLVTGDDFCKQSGIRHIDFLKIDAEGHDWEVLEGFSSMLAKRAIEAVQFEHEGGRFIRDFYSLLQQYDYSIGRLYANYVDFREHSIEMEHFLGPNYIAIPKDRRELLHSLKEGWK